MEKQCSFTDMEYSFRKKKTKRDRFLSDMDKIVPWTELVEEIRPFYPKGNRGRKPIAIEVMLRMYLLEIWFDLSDGATEDAIYDSYSMRSFVGVNFATVQVPDSTTLCKFRKLILKNGLDEKINEKISTCLAAKRKTLHPGSLINPVVK